MRDVIGCEDMRGDRLVVKTVLKCLISSVKLSSESQTICALLVKVRTVVALCEVGLYDVWSSSLSVCVGFL